MRRPSRLRPSSFGSVDRVSQLFNSKWAATPCASRNATPRNSLPGAAAPAPSTAAATTAQQGVGPAMHIADKVLAALHGRPKHEGAADADEGPLSPVASNMAPTTPSGEDAELLPAQLSEGRRP